MDATTQDRRYSYLAAPGEDTQALFKRIFARLREELPEYEFNESFTPFHSSYDNWHFFGKRRPRAALFSRKASSVSDSKPSSTRTRSEYATDSDETEREKDVYVIARVSVHLLRLEREFKLCQKVGEESDPEYRHFVKPLQFGRLPPRVPGEVPLCVSIVEAPGRNYLRELVEFGPAFYTGTPDSPQVQIHDQIPLLLFLDFAIGASECCEILHHGNEIVHGELRGDAFHYNRDTSAVRIVNFGGGARSFERGLTSAGWSSLMSERGVEHRLQFIAPEQTGRLPAEPDSRTDIYSLGIIFWTMLTGRAPFEGRTPLDIMQNVLSRRVPLVKTVRSDIPDALCSVIQKMTNKSMDDRYNSISGVKHDMQELKKILVDADEEALANFKVAKTDVSCFFNLPTHLVGRIEQRKQIITAIETAARRIARSAPVTRKGLYSLSSGSSMMSGERPDMSLLEDIISDSTSSNDRDRDSRLNSVAEFAPLEFTRSKPISQSQESISSSTSSVAGDLDFKPPAETRSSHDSRGSINESSVQRSSSSYMLNSEANSLMRTAQKLKRKGRTEIVTICGAAGHGKSSLVASIVPNARKHGYFVSAKFDQVRSSPFEPVVRIMSSLFRQIFSEQDVNTQFHENIRTFVKPFWGMLHAYLELPPWLLAPSASGTAHQKLNAALRNGVPAMPKKAERKMCSQQSTGDWLRSGGGNKQSRFMHIFLDVLRLLAVQKFICVCLDDLQFADEESLDLVQMIVKAHIPVVLIVTYRSEQTLSSGVKHAFHRATRVELDAFSEDDTAQYAADTLHRSKEYCMPLVGVIQEQSGGVPFFVREMMDSAYRKKCVYYCWKCSHWEFNLDRLFEQFSSPDRGTFSSNDFILRRFRDLPAGAQSLLAWGAVIGNSFSYHLLEKVMSCDTSLATTKDALPPTTPDPVNSLQVAIQAFILMPTEDEDRFRFSHDRYLAAAVSLCDRYNIEEMNYVLACAMMKYEPYDPVTQANKALFDQAGLVCKALSAIKQRAQVRLPFRDLLYQAAETAKESGARLAGIHYFEACIQLLQDDPWSDSKEDASYAETLTLYTRAAEAYWYHNDYDGASTCLKPIFANARSATDKAPASMICSRVSMQKGDHKSAFLRLRNLLADLGVTVPDRTWEECDAEYHRLMPLLHEHEPDFENVGNVDRELHVLGAVFIELTSASFWMDALLFYQSTLVLLNLSIERGVFPHAGIGFVNLASISVYRFGLVQVGIDFGNLARRYFEAFEREHYVIGRGLTLYAMFIGHISKDIREGFTDLNFGLEAASTAGDRILHILNMGIVAAFRLWSGEPLAEIEAFISSVGEEFPDWHKSLRGGVFLTAVRQHVRALEGKTHYRSAKGVMNDDHHTTEAYLDFIVKTSSHPSRPLTIYKSYQLVALYRFGYIKEALELAEDMLVQQDEIWSVRFTYQNLFFLCLCLAATVRENPKRSDRVDVLKRISTYKARIETIASVNSVNYKTWIDLIDAEICDLEGRNAGILQHYEDAVDHASIHGFTMDEALALELYGEWLARRGASRPARGQFMECISAYRRVGAFGKADQVSDRWAYILFGTRSLTTMDAGTQTTMIDAGHSASYPLERTVTRDTEQIGVARTQAWLDPHAPRAPQAPKEPPASVSGGLSAVGLDMIDLASILESSQLLSSELDVDSLLNKLTEVIVDSTGAELCGIVVEDDSNQWCVAAVGCPEGIHPPAAGIPLEQVDDPVGKQVTLYVLRFKEEVFVRNILEDERFANVPQSWLENNPDGMSVLALPILHGDNVLMGSLFCQAPPNIFTERTLTLLKLLVNQIAISIANALLFKRVAREQETNKSMLSVQRQATMQAKEAEKKAKAAEVKAIEMVRLKDEAAKAKSLFLANVSHELRTPLNGVLGMSEMLKNTPLNKEQEEHADSIRLCADTLLNVINDILDFSKLEAGKMQVFSVPLSLAETINEVVRALSYTNPEKHLETVQELDLDPNLVVMGDPVRLHQILMNLISNAYKFTSQGSVTIRAAIDWQDADSMYATVSVTDTGIGITEEQQKKLFLPFSQADSSTARSYGGTGLGLSICKAIIENIMSGRIWLESTPGVGTTVSFSIPFKKVKNTPNGETNGKATPHGREADPMALYTPPAASESESSRPFNSLSSVPRDKLKVCIAEDNPVNQKIAINFVKRLGFSCEAYGDGQQAVDALSRASKDGNPFHLVLMDVQMPVLDGYNATRAIRKHADPQVKDILVIAMTASAIRGDREKCLEAGMNNYLAKPVRADTLKQMLESYLNQPAKPIPNLQQETDQLVSRTLSQESVNGDSSARTNGENLSPDMHHNSSPQRPKSSQQYQTEIHLKPEEMVQQVQNMPTAKNLKESTRPPFIKRTSSYLNQSESAG